jgi:hypothetical protein
MIKALQIIKKQAIGLTFVIESILKGIIGFIAAYFFKPVWEKFLKWWTNKT